MNRDLESLKQSIKDFLKTRLLFSGNRFFPLLWRGKMPTGRWVRSLGVYAKPPNEF
jgi:hypothetical protein